MIFIQWLCQARGEQGRGSFGSSFPLAQNIFLASPHSPPSKKPNKNTNNNNNTKMSFCCTKWSKTDDFLRILAPLKVFPPVSLKFGCWYCHIICSTFHVVVVQNCTILCISGNNKRNVSKWVETSLRLVQWFLR